jgi:hypothetical protein
MTPKAAEITNRQFIALVLFSAFVLYISICTIAVIFGVNPVIEEQYDAAEQHTDRPLPNDWIVPVVSPDA